MRPSWAGLALLVAIGCVPAPLLRADDPGLREGASLLARSCPAESERAADRLRFLQAEAVYRARPTLEAPRGAWSYGLEVMAASTGLGPLSAAASQGGPLGLRLDGYNEAALLYEAFLADFPDSSLRSLALWRLGWAYRNTTASGLPRDSDAALRALAAEYPHAPEAAWVSEAQHAPWKSQRTLTWLALIPGLGQFYVGEPLNGSVRLAIGAGFGALALLPTLYLLRHDFRWGPALLATVGVIGFEVSVSSSFEAARRSALEFNEAEEARFETRYR
jgi:hypothetical protein